MSRPHHSPAWTPEQLLDMARGFQEARILLTGAELDLFTLLAPEPLPLPTVAARLQADPQALAILLDALSAMGLLVKREGAYQTEPSATRFLAADSPGSILPMVLHSANLWHRWGQLTRLVAPLHGAASSDEHRLHSFIGAMHVAASPHAANLVDLVEPGPARRLLDVGGGSGTYTLAFLAASPQMRATLFDRPAVVEMARQRLEAAGLLNRVTLTPGDYNQDPLPGGHDLVFLSAIIHQNTPAQNLELFRKCLAALEPGGRLVVRDHVLSPDRTRPRRGALFAVNMLVAENGGNSYTLEEIQASLEEVGFARVRLTHPDDRMDGLVEAFRPDGA